MPHRGGSPGILGKRPAPPSQVSQMPFEPFEGDQLRCPYFFPPGLMDVHVQAYVTLDSADGA
jgi:hypothetical protein